MEGIKYFSFLHNYISFLKKKLKNQNSQLLE